MLDLDNIRARTPPERTGLTKEKVIIREAQDPLLHLERRAYLCALSDALAGVETARLALGTAAARLEAVPSAGAA